MKPDFQRRKRDNSYLGFFPLQDSRSWIDLMYFPHHWCFVLCSVMTVVQISKPPELDCVGVFVASGSNRLFSACEREVCV